MHTPFAAALRQYDRSNMHAVLRDFPQQILHAQRTVEALPPRLLPRTRHIVVLGMGGSAIAGELLRTYAQWTPGADHLRIHVVRDYTLPPVVNRSTLVIASSYSGNTEETLEGFEQARTRTPHLVCLTSGGELSARAQALGIPILPLPSGYQPRCALGFSFFTLLFALLRYGYLRRFSHERISAAIRATFERLCALAESFSVESSANPALQLASTLHGHVLITYASPRTEAVALRWRQQFQENAKHAAFGNVLPEMNHNELNGWQFPSGFASSVRVLLFSDPEDHPRVQLRAELLPRLLSGSIPEHAYHRLRSSQPDFLTRMFELIYLGDWTSYWLALLNGVDPTEIPLILRLKSELHAR
jgi:glucose/mannose-6-phosphate isomerase